MSNPIDRLHTKRVLGVDQFENVDPNKVNQIIDAINNIINTGSVTQITSGTTGVTSNRASGVITTVTLTDATNTSSIFTVTSSSATINSTILATIVNYSGTYETNGLPIVSINNRTNGTFDIVVSNAHSTNALNGVLKIAYYIVG